MGFTKSMIRRDGTSQRQRLLKALDPAFIKIEERQTTDFLRILRQFATEITYYNKQNQIDGNWQDFFPEVSDLDILVNQLDKNDDLDPHLSLMITFLRLLNIAKNDLNKLTDKHLEFYYKNVLRFEEKKSVPDSVHVLFGLSKNISNPYLLKQKSLLNAGKDENGNNLYYQTDRDIVINKATIASIKTIFVDIEKDHRSYAAPFANSIDGIGGVLDPETPGWNTFGESQFGRSDSDRTMLDGELGFAVASPLLLLKEGSRTITLTIELSSFQLTQANIDRLSLTSDEDLLSALAKLSPILNQTYNSQSEFEAAIGAVLTEVEYNFYIDIILEESLNVLRGFKSSQFNTSFLGYATTTDSWFELNPVSISITDQNKLTMVFEMDAEYPPLVFFSGTDKIKGLPTTFPAIKIVFNPDADTYTYALLRDFQMVSYDIEVEVTGVQDLVIQNEDGPLDAGQAFLPFGARPSANANFYIGNHEVFQKRLKTVSATLSWSDLPSESGGFTSYYSGYTGSYANANRSAEVRYLQKGNWVRPPNSNIDLFNASGSGTFIQSPFTIQLPLLPSFERKPDVKEFTSFSTGNTSGFIRLSLKSPDFGHHVFQNQYAEQALAIVGGNTDPLPNIPYTPKLKSIKLNYTAQRKVTFGTQNDGFEQFFHIEPFGSLFKSTQIESTFCFPQLPQGSLFIGIEALQPPQNLSILFQVLEGSADPEITITRNDVKWSYLKNNDWIPLTDTEIQIDTTQGLQTSGILDFSIPSDASIQHSLLPSNLHWIKAEIQKDPVGISKTIGIHTQAISATFVSPKDTKQQFFKPLESGTISKLVSGVSSIKSIEQPYSSFGGRPFEQENDFINRISERLRHKQRAIGVWGYERIVLEEFPFIYKVKCLNHANAISEFSPGDVTLIVIPDLQNKNAANPLQPKTSSVLRESIKAYISRYIPLFVSIEVENPKYEPILVDLKVGLKPGFDGSFYGQLLNENLKRFLSPWAFEKGEDIVFGGRIYKSSILAFIEEQPYVDYVTDFRLFHLNKSPGIGEMCVANDSVESLDIAEIYFSNDFVVSANTIGDEALDFAEASTARSILVSAQKHTISVLEPGEFPCAGAEIPTGIGTMITEYDFIVS